MQDVDRVADVEGLAEPARHGCARVEAQARVPVMCTQGVYRIVGHRRRARHFRQDLSVGTPKLKLAVGQSLDLVSLFVDRAMVPATKEREI